jgi:hypothetical protein
MLRPNSRNPSLDALCPHGLEDKRFDRKSAKIQPKYLAKYLSGFGNGPFVEGGVLALGV